MERYVLPVSFFEIRAWTVVRPKDLDRSFAHVESSGYFNFKKFALTYNQANPVAITVMATSSPADSVKVAPQISSTSSSAMSSMSDIAS